MNRIYLLSPVLLLTLTAATCGEPRPVLILPPAELASCADEPAAPVLPSQDWTAAIETIKATQLQRDLLIRDYVFDFRAAWGDCRAKVNGLATWRENAK